MTEDANNNAATDTYSDVSSEASKIAKDDLFDILLKLESRDEAKRFMLDLCTPSEIASLAERWRIARALNEGKMSYRQIAAAIGASTTTVARVARFLKDEEHQGYALMLTRLSTNNL